MRVFLSSTHLDLADHRDAVSDAIARLGLQAVRMETFGARTEDPVEASLSEVEGSNLFIGVYAHRYGHIPPSSQMSVTEAEFRHAVSLGRPTFCFSIDQKYPWPPNMVDGEPGRTLLAAFLSNVETAVVRDTFTTPDVLASRVATALGRFLIAVATAQPDTRTLDHFVHLTIVDTAAVICVDVMRLLCVAGSEALRAAHAERYQEFVDVTDQHLGEFRAQVAKLAKGPGSDVSQMCAGIEDQVFWVFTELRRKSKLHKPWRAYASDVRKVGDAIDSLARIVGGEHYTSRAREAVEITQSVLDKLPDAAVLNAPEGFVRARHAAQSEIILRLRKRDGFAIGTIRDDIDKRLAVPYFAIDRALLRRIGTDG